MLRARTADETGMRANAAPSSSKTQIPQPALVICHPGHELKLFGWMTRARPVVHVLTDGSGSSKRSRLKSTERVLESARHYAELADEVERLSAVFGPNAFAVETLLPMRCLLSVPGNSPHYEEYGRRQVEAGHYPAVIRYTDHIAPLAAKLRAYVTE